ncbi:hypothetical protein EVA_03905, partial [gut metagenome]
KGYSFKLSLSTGVYSSRLLTYSLNPILQIAIDNFGLHKAVYAIMMAVLFLNGTLNKKRRMQNCMYGV